MRSHRLQMGKDASANNALPAEPGVLEIQPHGEAEASNREKTERLGRMSFGEIGNALLIREAMTRIRTVRPLVALYAGRTS